MVVDGDGERLLRPILPDDVLVEEAGDLARLVQREVTGLCWLVLREPLLDDLVAQRDALIADVDLRAQR